MPAILKLRPRMQRLLSPAVTQAELLGIIAWLGVLLASPVIWGLDLMAITLGLLIVFGCHRVAVNYRVWRSIGRGLRGAALRRLRLRDQRQR